MTYNDTMSEIKNRRMEMMNLRKNIRELQASIEPFLSTRCEHTTTEDDGWTLTTGAGNFSAQYEHTMLITKNKPIILTRL
jgi:methionine aminopeptidase